MRDRAVRDLVARWMMDQIWAHLLRSSNKDVMGYMIAMSKLTAAINASSSLRNGGDERDVLTKHMELFQYVRNADMRANHSVKCFPIVEQNVAKAYEGRRRERALDIHPFLFRGEVFHGRLSAAH